MRSQPPSTCTHTPKPTAEVCAGIMGHRFSREQSHRDVRRRSKSTSEAKPSQNVQGSERCAGRWGSLAIGGMLTLSVAGSGRGNPSPRAWCCRTFRPSSRTCVASCSLANQIRQRVRRECTGGAQSGSCGWGRCGGRCAELSCLPGCTRRDRQEYSPARADSSTGDTAC